MFRKISIAIAAAAAMSAAPALAEKPVRIGFSIAKTGLFAAGAPSELNAYELWREQVNAKGGLNVAGTKRMVEFVQYDDQSNPGNAVRIYEKLITDDKVDLLLAPWGTPHHFALAPVLEKYKFPMVGNTAASVQLRTIKPGYIWFVTSAIPDKMGTELAAMMKANGIKSAAIVANVLPLAKEIKAALVPALKKNGIELKVSEEYPPDIKDMTPLLSKVKAAAPQAVIVLSYPSDSVLYAKQAKELGINAPFQFVAVGPTIDFYSKVVGPAANGFVTMGHWSPDKKEWPRAKPFYDAYVAKFKEKPDYLDSVVSYMSCEILEQAVAKAGLDKAKLRQVIATSTFQTINGPVKFQGVQNAITPTAFLQIQGDGLQIVWPKSIATSAFKPKTSW
ncbi:MAG: amino acid ABC transporter substrate-binding protein [Rhodospirillaceae bacterium]|nr:amino acid ABC transporter substrate-binding protein [Rhodospirillaceae bacterium]